MRAVLTYHSIDESGSPISVSPDQFARHVEWLAQSAVRVVPLEALRALPAEDHAVAVTFDDAFVNFHEVAWPILRAAAFPVTLFVVSGHAGGTNAWGGVSDPAIPTLPLMNWDALGRVAEEGVALGGHTVRHPRLSELDAGDAREEIHRCQEDIARHTGIRPTAFAYPYGDLDATVAEVAGEVFDTAVTTRFAAFGPSEDPMLLPRLDAFYFREGGVSDWGTPRFERFIAFRRGLRRVRRVLTRIRP